MNCRPFTEGAGESAGWNFVLGAAGGYGAQVLSNNAKALQYNVNRNRALALNDQVYIPATDTMAGSVNRFGLIGGNVVSNGTNAAPPSP